MFDLIHKKLDRLEGEVRRLQGRLEAVADSLTRKVDHMDATLQRAIADIAKTKDIEVAVKAGFDLMGQQIAGLKQQIADLQAQVGQGSAVTAEDLAALGAAADDLEATNTRLTSDVPANTG